MPKPTKLHTKGKPISIQKAYHASKDSSLESSVYDNEDAVRQLELELCWCIQQLERTLKNKTGTEKEMQETWNTLQVLKNNDQPIIRKRQLMRTYFGDYRAKMLDEEKKLTKSPVIPEEGPTQRKDLPSCAAVVRKMKITKKPDQKATFLRKSAFRTTGDGSFRFNFNPALDQENKGNPVMNFSNIELADFAVSYSNADAGTAHLIETPKQPVEDNSNTFKFKFSGTEFKFNFGHEHVDS